MVAWWVRWWQCQHGEILLRDMGREEEKIGAALGRARMGKGVARVGLAWVWPRWLRSHFSDVVR